jgi:RNA polymerase sigma-70 factor (ECF subfamily)
VDEASLHEFVHSTYPRLVAAVALIAGSRAAAEDAVQEALARAWERSSRGERIDSLPAWITTVSMNLARSGLRRLCAERRARAALMPPTAIDETTDRADLARALRALPRRQREAVVLHYYLGLEVSEIAAAMRAPAGTVKSLLFRGRAALARTLGVDEEEVSER